MLAKLCLATLLALSVAVPASARAAVGPDYVASDNLELVDRLKTVGDGVGGRIVGDRLYVTSTKSLSIYDIKTDPEHPKLIGQDTMDIEFENEEVPTNGKLLGISGQIGCADPLQANVITTGKVGSESTGCLTLYDVSNPESVKKYGSISGAGQHTSACVLDCKYLYGSTGAVTDATDPAKAKLIGDWQLGLPDGKKTFKASCHHLREIQPGIILGSCQPIILMSIRPEDGGSVLKPVVLATGTNQDERFIHSGRWPNGGTDKFLLIGGETNAEPVCNDTVGSFMVWDASAVGKAASPNKGAQFKLLDEIRPINGNYADGHSPTNGLGCSVHWFQEHPSFKNGGLVANAQYENGTRLLQVTPAGKIVEQGFFLPLGGSTSSPLWNPNGKVIYSVDYARGVDVLKYTGPTYVPDAQGNVNPEPGTTPGTEGSKPGGDAAPCASAAGFKGVRTRPKGAGLSFTPKLRQQKPFDVDVLQQSSGRKVVDDKVVARFRGKTGAFSWKGRKGLASGNYYVRYTMPLDNGLKDVRRVTFLRKRGTFRRTKAFSQRLECGVFSRFRLGSAVFGGRGRAALKGVYRLERGADVVTIDVRQGQKLVTRLRGPGKAGKLYPFSVPARKLKRGKLVTVQAFAKVGQTIKSQKLFARKL